MLTIKIPMLSNFSLGQLVCTNRINDKIEQDNEFKKFVEESWLDIPVVTGVIHVMKM